MKIFISWSGQSSRLVAEALSDWLQRVIQAVKPFYSPDIDKGAKWSNEIDAALEGTRFGIICLTPDNLKSEWIHYESGALSKTKDASIWTFLLDLKPSDVKQPLGRFQHTLAEKSDVLKMLKSINAKLSDVGGESLKDSLLEEIFSESWSKLEVRLNDAKNSIKNKSGDEIILPTGTTRTDNDKLDEILEILRTHQRQINFLSKSPLERSLELFERKDEPSGAILRILVPKEEFDYDEKLDIFTSQLEKKFPNTQISYSLNEDIETNFSFRVKFFKTVNKSYLLRRLREIVEMTDVKLKSVLVVTSDGKTTDLRFNENEAVNKPL